MVLIPETLKGQSREEGKGRIPRAVPSVSLFLGSTSARCVSRSISLAGEIIGQETF